ncbi:CBS domain protein [Desulfallas thermosapovorans DSM 6562]|uniref:CBS domain protein n=2 Tax=Desulfallas thermosapovorans TaxID=58137 RepID=A0A5S4ZPK9_9FIRM|nr:CBS domain protein [Desulfallas thermosapovorans DSM 6562]
MVPVDDFPVIREDYVVAEAVKIMRQFFHQQDGTWFGFQAALVLDANEQLVGLLTLRRLLQAFKLRAIQDHLLTSYAEVFFMPGGSHQHMEITVKEIMRPIGAITVQKDDNIFKAVRQMVERKINLLPVLEGSELVGMVRTIDMFWIIGELLD